MAAFLTHLKELKTTSLVLVGTSIKNTSFIFKNVYPNGVYILKFSHRGRWPQTFFMSTYPHGRVAANKTWPYFDHGRVATTPIFQLTRRSSYGATRPRSKLLEILFAATFKVVGNFICGHNVKTLKYPYNDRNTTKN